MERTAPSGINRNWLSLFPRDQESRDSDLLRAPGIPKPPRNQTEPPLRKKTSLATDGHGFTRIRKGLVFICVHPCPSVANNVSAWTRRAHSHSTRSGVLSLISALLLSTASEVPDRDRPRSSRSTRLRHRGETKRRHERGTPAPHHSCGPSPPRLWIADWRSSTRTSRVSEWGCSPRIAAARAWLAPCWYAFRINSRLVSLTAR